MDKNKCYHCGDICENTTLTIQDKMFCCNGCKTVYEILSESDLTCYYDLETSPGAAPKEIEGKYDFLSEEKIIEKLVEFDDGKTQIVTLYIPHIHCSSCIWILENLNKLNAAITHSQVNFGKKTVRVTYNLNAFNLKALVILLSTVGYEPYISLDDYKTGKENVNRSLIYKLGVAGFAFGNAMFLSFPEYFEVNEYWLEKYKHVFRWLMFIYSLPVVFYAAQDYFISAYKAIKTKVLNIDIPIALGVIVLFVRSTVEIVFDYGSGFFDSLTGLIFFLLLGRFFQQKTYSFLSFERDYKSYFPIAVTKIINNTEVPVQVYDIKKGDRLLIRNQELIPVDGILINGDAKIDYSFVTGESEAVTKQSGDKLFAGGKQTKGVIEMEAIKSVEQSYLTQLWSNDVFNKNKEEGFTNLTNAISKRFTVIVLSIAVLSTLFWLFVDSSKALNVFTAVLIIACPCAIALSAPFTFGNLLRIFGKKKFYLKNASVIEQLSHINTIIFDKTGTITSNKKSEAVYNGLPLSTEEEVLLKNTLRGSNHPLSRSLYNILQSNNIITLDSYEEYLGQGIQATHASKSIKIGSAKFVGYQSETEVLNTAVHISANNTYKGKFTFYNSYRKGLSKLFNKLKKNFDLAILSGDNEGEKDNLKKLLPSKTKLLFNQKPNDKLEYIKYHQDEGAKVLMVGDGLNDAGALAQSDVGIVISENINVFSPACDAILDATKFNQLYSFIKASKSAVKIIKWSFLLSFFYNVIGLYFAVTGQLAPVIAAILMPLSSISIVVFTTIATNILGKRLK
ncbi:MULTISPECIES: heavy metal translocating P-type ATPase [Mesoflavibacter]|uniref:Heavy metal translocating P-type ATPase metal-binding domain-containing protein n=1 Tax=Mesoflavibacter profundi TaxID=2708110 RepID=A0ABT4RWX4_9FLAO|nr:MULTISPECIES: heavy metal translocating P-type ATPase metal-binding domain-containing protein [Mesoflavibacter]MDA0176332.1 heavy metal translocating P-type ATPase metal-binding domain-containing protein [Mesoflavibacter profundi]QIJ89972.1 Type cbb3 cytochrome oxidase biogenesis protein CcoI [Mesoflavibacter sp. HG96]QIJ92700.1 Type cbb3 cytochrome oxidase biogenesis protein CcoI [Mesoflavibacter sp. HG37]